MSCLFRKERIRQNHQIITSQVTTYHPSLMQIISKYFSSLTETQTKQLSMLQDLYNDWNAKINVISRKDIQQLYEHHVLHSLAIAKFISFKSGTNILDFGTGGGFPGIPLAILFPECQFTLIDGTGKKSPSGSRSCYHDRSQEC